MFLASLRPCCEEMDAFASCDGDFLAMESMVCASIYLDAPCMMSNMYPVTYVGALRDRLRRLAVSRLVRFPRSRWKNLARLAHCGFVGIVPAEMTPSGKVTLSDFGGTYEIHRDGKGAESTAICAGTSERLLHRVEFDGKTLIAAGLQVVETTRHDLRRPLRVDFTAGVRRSSEAHSQHLERAYGDPVWRSSPRTIDSRRCWSSHTWLANHGVRERTVVLGRAQRSAAPSSLQRHDVPLIAAHGWRLGVGWRESGCHVDLLRSLRTIRIAAQIHRVHLRQVRIACSHHAPRESSG